MVRIRTTFLLSVFCISDVFFSAPMRVGTFWTLEMISYKFCIEKYANLFIYKKFLKISKIEFFYMNLFITHYL